MKLRLFPAVSVLIIVSLLVQGTSLPVAARAELEFAEPAAGQMHYGAQGSGSVSNGGQLNALGLRWAKLQIPWKDFEPNPGDYRWGSLDTILQAYSSTGINVMLSVVKAPNWARSPSDDFSVEGPPADYATLANFLTQMVYRYFGQIRAIEVWNEQNLWYEGGGRPMAPESYVQMLRVAYEAIKAADPTIEVISGAPTPTGLNDGRYAIDDVIYVQRMYSAGLKQYCDAVGAHPGGLNNPPDAKLGYTDPNEPTFKSHRSFFFRETLEAYRNAMVAAGDAAKKVWATEFGWATTTNPPSGYDYARDNTPEEQAQYIVRAYQMGANWGWVGGMFLWNLDFGLVAPGSELAMFSLLPPGPAYYAVAAMAKSGEDYTSIVAGRVTDGVGNGIPGVVISGNAGHNANSSSGGYYTLVGLANGTYTVTPSKPGYLFSPPARTVRVSPNAIQQNFVGASMSVAHIEITQVTQDEGNSTPLIASKPTFARVYVNCGDGCSEMPGVTGILRAYGTAGELPQSPKPSLNNSVVARHEDWRNQRSDLSKTLNFNIPPEWTSGAVTLRAEVSGATRSEPFSFVEARQPNVIYVPVHFENTDPSNRIDDAFSWARQNWPTSRINYLRWPVFNWSPNLLCRLSADCLRADLKTKLTELYWQGQVGGYIFGWLANGAESRLGVWGSSDPAWNGGYGKAAFGVDHPTDGPVIFTHEMAHLMGRHHPDSADSCVPGIDPNSDWPHDNARIQQWGLDGYRFGWLIGSASALKDPATTYDYMSYCWGNDYGAKPAWTSPWTFQRIYEQTLRPTAATFASQPLAEPTPYFAVSGLMFSNATATLNPAWIITPTLAPDNPPVGVGYCLEAQDATSAVLTSRCFDLTFVDYDTGAPTNVRGFNLTLPYLPNVKRLVLKKGASELAVQPVSDHAPVINVVSPNGGETWAASGTYTITWTASDLDTDPLTYSVFYSPDGNNWVPIGTAITTTQLAVNAADLAGGTAARVRVMATDGVNTSSDESDTAFTVGRKGPNVFILTPTSDVRFMPGTPLWLQGYGYDLEDGMLEGAALRWRSDQDGDLASGEQALVTLSPGQHTITLTATDSQGNPATASINVFAGGRTHLPLVMR